MSICLTGGDRGVGKIFVDHGAFNFDVDSVFDRDWETNIHYISYS